MIKLQTIEKKDALKLKHRSLQSSGLLSQAIVSISLVLQ